RRRGARGHGRAKRLRPRRRRPRRPAPQDAGRSTSEPSAPRDGHGSLPRERKVAKHGPTSHDVGVNLSKYRTMDHIALMGPATAGDLTPLSTLGRALQERGHRITLVGPLDAEPTVKAAGLGFAPYGVDAYPRGATQAFVDR